MKLPRITFASIIAALWGGTIARVRLFACACMLLAFANAGNGIVQQGWTYDEGNHIGWAMRLLQDCPIDRSFYYRGEAPLSPEPECLVSRQKYWGHATTTPGSLAHVALGSALLQLWPGKVDYDTQRIFLRLAGLLWLGLGFAVVHQLASRVTPLKTARWAAVALVALDPNFAAHASVVTVDLPLAVTTGMTLVALIDLVQLARRRPPVLEKTTKRSRKISWAAVLPAHQQWSARYVEAGCALGLAFGLALAAKLTALLLLPIFLLLLFAVPRGMFRPLPFARLFGGLLIAAVVTLLMLNAAYMFRGEWLALDGWLFQAALLRDVQALLPGSLILPVPETYLEGVSLTLARERGAVWNVVLLDQYFPQGTRLYYLVTWLTKTPLLVQAACLLGIGAVIWRGVQGSMGWRRILTLVMTGLATTGYITAAWLMDLPAIAHIGAALLLVAIAMAIHGALNWKWRLLALYVIGWALYFSLEFKAQTGHRYLLPSLPALYVCAGCGLALLWLRIRFSKAMLLPVAAACAALLAVCLATTVRDFGNPVGYVSAAIPDRDNAWKVLADSNIDWGQARNKGTSWGGDISISLTNFNPYDLPDEARWQALRDQHGWQGAREFNPRQLVPGTQLLEINWWTGVFGGFERFADARRDITPTGTIDGSLIALDLDADSHADWLRKARALKPMREDCPPPVQAPRDDGSIDGATCARLCVMAADAGAYGFTSSRYMLSVKPRGNRRFDDQYWQGQQGWLWLEAGAHELEINKDAAFLPFDSNSATTSCMTAREVSE